MYDCIAPQNTFDPSVRLCVTISYQILAMVLLQLPRKCAILWFNNLIILNDLWSFSCDFRRTLVRRLLLWKLIGFQPDFCHLITLWNHFHYCLIPSFVLRWQGYSPQRFNVNIVQNKRVSLLQHSCSNSWIPTMWPDLACSWKHLGSDGSFKTAFSNWASVTTDVQ